MTDEKVLYAVERYLSASVYQHIAARLRGEAAQGEQQAVAIGEPIDADSDVDYLRKLGDRIGGPCASVLHGIAASLSEYRNEAKASRNAPAPVAGDAVAPVIEWLRKSAAACGPSEYGQGCRDAMNETAEKLAALAKDREA